MNLIDRTKKSIAQQTRQLIDRTVDIVAYPRRAIVTAAPLAIGGAMMVAGVKSPYATVPALISGFGLLGLPFKAPGYTQPPKHTKDILQGALLGAAAASYDILKNKKNMSASIEAGLAVLGGAVLNWGMERLADKIADDRPTHEQKRAQTKRLNQEQKARQAFNHTIPAELTAKAEDISYIASTHLASGESGRVYKGTYQGEDAAIKIYGVPGSTPLKKDELNSIKALKSAGLLEYPSLVGIKGFVPADMNADYGATQQQYEISSNNALIMEYIEGETLKNTVNSISWGGFDVKEAAAPTENLRNWAADIADLTQKAGSKGLFFGDLHANNIMIDPSNRLRFIDLSFQINTMQEAGLRDYANLSANQYKDLICNDLTTTPDRMPPAVSIIRKLLAAIPEAEQNSNTKAAIQCADNIIRAEFELAVRGVKKRSRQEQEDILAALDVQQAKAASKKQIFSPGGSDEEAQTILTALHEEKQQEPLSPQLQQKADMHAQLQEVISDPHNDTAMLKAAQRIRQETEQLYKLLAQYRSPTVANFKTAS